ncbi:MAG: YebC/PmpR family DNA-binding regulatory protein [bacterium]|jgi:YebC/PmpR family DNA-binding regulatory protein
MSGHNKWSSIKHRKGAQDAKRSKVFTKVIKEITVAAKIGGGEVESNPRLRTAILWGKSVNMPRHNIENAIKKGTGEKGSSMYENIIYEGYGPHQTAVIVETLTDNRNRTICSVRTIFNKKGGNLGSSNSVMYMFDRIGVIEVEKAGIDEDTITEHILEGGADDIDTSDEEVYRITTDASELHTVIEYLEGQKVEVKSGKLDLVPQNKIEITEVEKAKQAMAFIDALEDDDDVQSVYSNFDISDDVVAALNAE